jgi:hypothetical protein
MGKLPRFTGFVPSSVCQVVEVLTVLSKQIKMEPIEIGLSVVDWIGLAQGRYRWRALVIAVMNLLFP